MRPTMSHTSMNKLLSRYILYPIRQHINSFVRCIHTSNAQ